MRRILAIQSAILLTTLSCLASSIPSAKRFGEITQARQSCLRVTTAAPLTLLAFGEVELPGITAVTASNSAGDEQLQDSDIGCCWIDAGGSDKTYKHTTWKQCKMATKEITHVDADPKDFHKNVDCPASK